MVSVAGFCSCSPWGLSWTAPMRPFANGRPLTVSTGVIVTSTALSRASLVIVSVYVVPSAPVTVIEFSKPPYIFCVAPVLSRASVTLIGSGVCGNAGAGPWGAGAGVAVATGSGLTVGIGTRPPGASTWTG